jgi:cytochrome b subunit of formate dehydrogenase
VRLGKLVAARARAACLGLVLGLLAAPWAAAAARLDNGGCLNCHDGQTALHQRKADTDDAKPLLAVPRAAYAQSVHARMQCVDCHTSITDNPRRGSGHQRAVPTPATGCADCHLKLWDTARRDATAAARPRLGEVVKNVEAWRQSFHARQNKDEPERINATCDNCHDTHRFNIPPAGSPERQAWRPDSNAICGESCHTDETEEYRPSAHGQELIDQRNAKAATCYDCHGAHAVGDTSAAPVKLAITARCGSCHLGHYKSYKATYHGQLSTLGESNTALCFNCHGSHEILPAKDKASRANAGRRLRTCKSCHNGRKTLAVAPAGFASFLPHPRHDDFAHQPQVGLAWWSMVGLLVGTFAFFWAHSALWFWRELMDRRQGRLRPRVLAAVLPPAQEGRHVQRFSAPWRIAHLAFALSLMLLALTGMPLLYPDAAWAPWVMKALGGPAAAGLLHRLSAVVMIAIFVGHLVHIARALWRERKTFRWFGPDSLLPNLQDGRDIVAMFRWFLGRGPRPVFERWTYWEKFDYWAPFWGVALLAATGVLLWLPTLAATYLPGWVLNVAALLHGEEALLAVVFLFTVHFFNNHFRPDKFPLEIVMFTGTMSLEHFRREHALQYRRLVASGELERVLVDAPAPALTLRAQILGYALIALGLLLLAGVAVGFLGAL